MGCKTFPIPRPNLQHSPYALCNKELAEHRNDDGNAHVNPCQVSHDTIEKIQLSGALSAFIVGFAGEAGDWRSR